MMWVLDVHVRLVELEVVGVPSCKDYLEQRLNHHIVIYVDYGSLFLLLLPCMKASDLAACCPYRTIHLSSLGHI